MSYYVIYKDLLFKENDKYFLLECGKDNNVWYYNYKNTYNFKVFNNYDEIVNYAKSFNDPNNQLAYVNGKFISSLDYQKRLLKLIKKPSNTDLYTIWIKQFKGVYNTDLGLKFDADAWISLNNDYEARNAFIKKYGSEVIFKSDYRKDLKLSDLNNDLKHVEIEIYKKKGNI